MHRPRRVMGPCVSWTGHAGAFAAYAVEEDRMSKWTKWIAVTVIVALPTVGYAVTKYRAHHRACPASPACPCANK